MSQIVDAPFARQFLQRLHGAANAHDADAVVANGRLFDRAALDALRRHLETRAAR
jgi:hypothetical protein